jgi:hypothetical protein
VKRHDGYRRRDYLAPRVPVQFADGRVELVDLHLATRPTAGAFRGAMLSLAVACVEHKRWLEWAPVEGTYVEDKPCNPACEGATGPSCDCSCGGDNHGGRWAA